MQKIKLNTLLTTHSTMERHGCRYGLGDKASPLSKAPETIKKIDCSGFTRYSMNRSGVLMPDGSQMQRAWCEENVGKPGSVVKKKVRYQDLLLPEVMADPKRLFICFIKPFTNGCGKVGHVWFAYMGETMESCGSRGVCSRSLATGVLMREVYSAYELEVE